MGYLVLYVLLLFPFFVQSQNIKALDNQNGYKDFKFGMTTEEINKIGIFNIPLKSDQLVATEYQNVDVTYVAYFDLNTFEILKSNGYAFYMGKPIKYICLLFYKNKLFKIRLHFFEQYNDINAGILEATNSYYGVPTKMEHGAKTGQLNGLGSKYNGLSEDNGTNTTIVFEKLMVEELIKANLPFDEPNLAKFYKSNVFALLIGIKDYSQTEATMLKYCDKDADKMSLFLSSPQGGSVPSSQIVLLKDTDATKDNILAGANKIFSMAQPNDIVIFFFSGHGGPNSFLAYDELIFHRDLKNIIYNCKAKIKLCFADACHAGSWDKKYSISTKDMSPDQMTQLYYQTIASAGEGTVLFMASQSDETSLDDPKLKQGLFTYFLLEGLGGKADTDYDQIITIEELYYYTKHKVSERAKTVYSHSQHPQLKGTFDHSTPIGIRK